LIVLVREPRISPLLLLVIIIVMMIARGPPILGIDDGVSVGEPWFDSNSSHQDHTRQQCSFFLDHSDVVKVRVVSMHIINRPDVGSTMSAVYQE